MKFDFKMPEHNLTKLVIFGDIEKTNVERAIKEFMRFTKGKAEIIGSCEMGKCTNDMLKDSDFVVVFGGDGSIISAARSLSRFQKIVPVIGVNLG